MVAEYVIDQLYADHKSVLDFLESRGEVSLRTIADNSFKKLLVLAAASYFEQVIQELIIQFVSDQSDANEIVVSILKAKAVDRQYHTYFEWDSKNANRFFSLFGSDFSDAAKEAITGSEELDEAVRAFLELGKTRNALMHSNVANYFLEKTAEEIYQLYKKAGQFMGFLPPQFARFSRRSGL